MTDKNTTQFLAEKYTKHWIKTNKELISDYQEICELILLFQMNWGFELAVVLKAPKDIRGRELGKSEEIIK